MMMMRRRRRNGNWDNASTKGGYDVILFSRNN
jgi:hypothetical protein